MMAEMPRTGLARYLSDGWDGVALRMGSRVVVCGAVGWFFPLVGIIWFVMGTLREASHVGYILRRWTPSRRVGKVALAGTLEATIESVGPIPAVSDQPRVVDEDAPPRVTGRGILATLALFYGMGIIWAVVVADVSITQAAVQGLSAVMVAPILLALIFGALYVLIMFLGDPFIEAVFAFGHLGAAALPRRAWRIAAHDAVDAKAEAVVLWATRPKDQPLFPRLAVSRKMWLTVASVCSVIFGLAVLVAA